MNTLIVRSEEGGNKISRHIYGHFSEHLGGCIYGGFWVGMDSAIPHVRGIRSDVVEALRRIRIPNLRWPGGCFADEYHWMDGTGSPEKRPSMHNSHWGGVTENNHFGTHEFMDLCGQLGCEPYICGNLGSGTVREMQQWIEYLTQAGDSPMAYLRRANGREEPWSVSFWGIGNENWGCGGHMRPEYYADEFRRYATYCRNIGENRIYKIACGPNGGNYRWTEVLMREAAGMMNGLALHYYCGTGKKSRSATSFEEEDWVAQLKQALHMEKLVTKHSAIMDQYDPKRKVDLVVDEWGAWHAVEPGTNPHFLYQQNSLRDALVAGVTLNIFNNHCDRVKMANIAQTINVLQAMFLTRNESMILTPTYHVFDMYKVHQDATLMPCVLSCEDYQCGPDSIPSISASASRDQEGRVHISLCNLHAGKEMELSCEVEGLAPRRLAGCVLTAARTTDHNSFENRDVVKPAMYAGARLVGSRLSAVLPSKSLVAIELS